MNARDLNDEAIKAHLFRIPFLRVAGLWAVPVLVCVLALMPMWPVARNFRSDWYNHLWLIEYAGYHLWLTGTPPEVLNTPQAVGMPMLLFYAQKFYTVLGAFSFVLGSALTVRLAALVVLLLQFGHVQRAARASGAPACLCLVLPVLVTWQVFQATTLYERGGVPEYFAIMFLTIAVANLYVLAVRTAQQLPDPYGYWTTGLYYGLAAVTHPLTAVYGGAFVVLTGLSVLLVARGKRMLCFAAFNLVALSLLLAPWLWMALRYARNTSIARPESNAELMVGLYASTPISTLLKTFSPNSFCSYSSLASPEQIVPAELNIQLSLPLLLLVLGIIAVFRRFQLRCSAAAPVLRTLLAVAYGIFWISLLVYCSPGVSFLFGHAFDVLQFAYRLGAYVNLALFLGTLASLGLVDWDQVRSVKFPSMLCRAGAVALVILGGVGWFSKCGFIEWSHYYGKGVDGLETLLRKRHFETRKLGYWVPGECDQDDVHITDLPATGYFQSDYDVRVGLRDVHELSPDKGILVIPFELGKPFGSVIPMEVAFRQRTMVLTNVNPFPWNEVLLDGRPVPGRDLFALPSAYGLRSFHPRAYGLLVDGGRHTLAYRFSPDPFWRWLNALSWLTLAGWSATSFSTAGLQWRRRIRLNAPREFPIPGAF